MLQQLLAIRFKSKQRCADVPQYGYMPMKTWLGDCGDAGTNTQQGPQSLACRVPRVASVMFAGAVEDSRNQSHSTRFFELEEWTPYSKSRPAEYLRPENVRTL